MQLYLHHIFGPSDLITGEGAEFRGNHDAAPLPHPYYTVVNGSHFASQMSRYTLCCWTSPHPNTLMKANWAGGVGSEGPVLNCFFAPEIPHGTSLC